MVYIPHHQMKRNFIRNISYMTKFYIAAAATLITGSALAQRGHTTATPLATSTPVSRITAIGDTAVMANVAAGSALTLFSVGRDSGYVTGTNYWNDKAFAERYSFSGRDSSVRVIGVIARFGGTVSPASTKAVTFTIWDQSDRVLISEDAAYNGFPRTVKATHTVPVTALGVGTDTLKMHLFTTPSPILTAPFFAGYSINYDFNSLNGDTIGLATTADSVRIGVKYTIDVTFPYGDTLATFVRNVQNATMYADGKWHDNYTDNYRLFSNLAIYPIVTIGAPSGTAGIIRSNFTLYGNYPNPAINATDIRLSLPMRADVTVQIMDMAGRTVSTISQPQLAPGLHNIAVNTATLAAGDYIYLIRSGNDGIAGKMTVIR